MTLLRIALLTVAAVSLAVPASGQSRPAAPAAPAASDRAVPIGQLFPFLDRYYRIRPADRSLFRLGYRIRSGSGPFAGRMWLLDPANTRTPLEVGPQGQIRRLPTAEMLSTRGWRVTTDAPQGTRFNVNMEVQPTLQPAAEMSAPVLAQTVAQTNRAIRGAAGLARFAVPTMTRVVFTGVRGGEAVLADGRVVALPVADGGPNFTPATLPTARTLRFPSAPERVTIGPAAARARR